jgi:hypothetical protein
MLKDKNPQTPRSYPKAQIRQGADRVLRNARKKGRSDKISKKSEWPKAVNACQSARPLGRQRVRKSSRRGM